MTTKIILEIILSILCLVYVLTVVGISCYQIMSYEGIHPDYVSDKMWEVLSEQWTRNDNDIKTFHKIEKAKNREYKHYARKGII